MFSGTTLPILTPSVLKNLSRLTASRLTSPISETPTTQYRRMTVYAIHKLIGKRSPENRIRTTEYLKVTNMRGTHRTMFVYIHWEETLRGIFVLQTFANKTYVTHHQPHGYKNTHLDISAT